MARLSKHGRELGRIESPSKVKAYFDSGDILVNHGHGWKVYGKCKIEPADAFRAALERKQKFLSENPAAAAFAAYIQDLAGISKRWKLVLGLELLSNDPDGLWSEVCDQYHRDGVIATIDEIVKLCDLYHAALEEQKGKVGHV